MGKQASSNSSFDNCHPNPCWNSGTCALTENGYRCHCPILYNGSLCEIGIDDCCKEDNESTYQGHASHARHGKRCLYWNSHIILSPQMILQMQNNGSEFEEHNYCRF
ncbi:factor VII-activating protease-like isoform X1 [Rhinoraja longicauda]